VQQFPELIVARALGFDEQQMLKFAAAELKDVDISKRFNA
jgi:LemA protein